MNDERMHEIAQGHAKRHPEQLWLGEDGLWHINLPEEYTEIAYNQVCRDCDIIISPDTWYGACQRFDTDVVPYHSNVRWEQDCRYLRQFRAALNRRQGEKPPKRARSLSYKDAVHGPPQSTDSPPAYNDLFPEPEKPPPYGNVTTV